MRDATQGIQIYDSFLLEQMVEGQQTFFRFIQDAFNKAHPAMFHFGAAFSVNFVIPGEIHMINIRSFAGPVLFKYDSDLRQCMKTENMKLMSSLKYEF